MLQAQSLIVSLAASTVFSLFSWYAWSRRSSSSAPPPSGQGDEHLKAMIQEAISTAMAAQMEQLAKYREEACVSPGQL